MRKFLASIPIPMAGVALGLTALGNLLQVFSEHIRLFCGMLGAVFAILVIMKLIFCPSVVKNELKDPIIASVSATVFMSMMQLSTYMHPAVPILAFTIWTIAVILHLTLIIYYTVKFIFHFRLEEVFPTCFITYVGIIVASITSVSYHLEELGKWIFWGGFIAYGLVFIMVTYRYTKHEIHEGGKPLFCIYAAPMSLSLTGYISVMNEKSLALMMVMEISAQLLYLAVLFQLPKLLKMKFYPSFAAFTFPFVITAFGLQKMLGCLQDMQIMIPSVLHMIVWVEMLIAIALVGFTVVHYIRHLSSNFKRTVLNMAELEA